MATPPHPIRRRRHRAPLRAAAVLLAPLAFGACERAPASGRIADARILGGVGEVPGAYGAPRAVDHDAEALWVADKTARVQRIDPRTGACLAYFRMPIAERGKPVGITVVQQADGPYLYVPDTHYHRVLVYRASTDPLPGAGARTRTRTLEPEPVRTFGAYGTGPGEFIYPTDVGVLRAADGTPERIYVSEYGGNDRVSVFDGAGTFLFSFGALGRSADAARIEFDRPQSLLVDERRRELLVADAHNHRLGRFTLDGALIAWLGRPDGPGEEPGAFRYPYGLAALADGTVLVSEFGGNRVQRIDIETGRGLGCWGTPGREPGELASPWAVTVLDGLVYVVDTGNNRLVAFRSPVREVATR